MSVVFPQDHIPAKAMPQRPSISIFCACIILIFVFLCCFLFLLFSFLSPLCLLYLSVSFTLLQRGFPFCFYLGNTNHVDNDWIMTIWRMSKSTTVIQSNQTAWRLDATPSMTSTPNKRDHCRVAIATRHTTVVGARSNDTTNSPNGEHNVDGTTLYGM